MCKPIKTKTSNNTRFLSHAWLHSIILLLVARFWYVLRRIFSPSLPNPSWLHTIPASSFVQFSSHTVPKWLSWHNSTRPSALLKPPTKRTSPSAQEKFESVIQGHSSPYTFAKPYSFQPSIEKNIFVHPHPHHAHLPH